MWRRLQRMVAVLVIAKLQKDHIRGTIGVLLLVDLVRISRHDQIRTLQRSAACAHVEEVSGGVTEMSRADSHPPCFLDRDAGWRRTSVANSLKPRNESYVRKIQAGSPAAVRKAQQPSMADAERSRRPGDDCPRIVRRAMPLFCCSGQQPR